MTFFRYEPKVSNPNPNQISDFFSYCDQTFTGWFHKDQGSSWGCFVGHKVANVEHHQDVLEHSASYVMASLPSSNSPHASGLTSFLERFTSRSPRQRSVDLSAIPRTALSDTAFVQLLNSNKSRSWTAAVHSHLTGLPLATREHMRGVSRSGKGISVTARQDDRPGIVIPRYGGVISRQSSDSKAAYMPLSPSFFSLIPASVIVVCLVVMPACSSPKLLCYATVTVLCPEADDIKYKDLPSEFDWRQIEGGGYMTPVVSQVFRCSVGRWTFCGLVVDLPFCVVTPRKEGMWVYKVAME